MSEALMRPIGVILAGGRSSRMGADKAFIDYHGMPQVEWLRRLMIPFCHDVVVVFKKAPDNFRFPFLLDDAAWGDIGPLAGVMTAHAAFPNHALMVIGCDYPLITEETLRLLSEDRSPGYAAVSVINPADGKPEPLLTLYETAAFSELKTFCLNGGQSLRKFLGGIAVKSITLPDQQQLLSIDTPEQAELLLKKRMK
ncbi:MAG: molybdenum cofactor guanylyltransferase [Bacteroidota bacterium]